jgi:arylsulfatase A-like enzyme
MQLRTPKPILLMFPLLLLACGKSGEQQSSSLEKERPNVLFIAIDDLNDWLGCMGGHPDAKTPNIDRLAREGVLFSNAHCQAPLCGPSRASLMSGLRPSTTGIYGQIDDEDIRRDNPATADVVFLPEYFGRQGYHTMGIGKLFHQHAPAGVFAESGGRKGGFGPKPPERLKWQGIGGEGYGNTSTDWGAYPAADSLMPDYRSAQWAIDRLQKSYEQPFFLAVGFVRPHVPLLVPQKWFDLFDNVEVDTPPYNPDDWVDLPEIAAQIDELPMMPTTEWAITNHEWKNIITAYLACVAFVDHYVGAVLEALRQSPYADNTIVVLWSDHGYRLGEKGTFAKHCLWEEATRAPLIFSGPGIEQGKIVHSPAEMLSIYPTLVELCGLPGYPLSEGMSLAGILGGNNAPVPEAAITTYGWKNHAVRTLKYRYIQYEDGSEELYDHASDPNEWDNLVYTGDRQGVAEQLKKRLPALNRPYALHSGYDINPFFRAQKPRSVLEMAR